MLNYFDRYWGYSTTYDLPEFCMRTTNEVFLSNQWKKILKSNNFDSMKSRELLTNLVFRGIPNDVRGDVWKKFACLGIDFTDIESQYDTLHEHSSESANDIILRDSDRTFASSIGNKRAGSFIDPLIKILRSYAALDEQVGYTQGMNFIASIPLILTKDEYKSFCTFYGMMKNPLIGLRDIYVDGFPGFFELANVWTFFLEKKYPWLFHKLKSNPNANILILVSKCFQSLLLAFDVPLELKLNMFDRIILFGKASLVSFEMAVIKIFENELRSLSEFDIQRFFFQVDQNRIFNDVPYILKVWNEEWITQEEFQKAQNIVNSQSS